jgi:hypothetical protein
VGARQVTVRLMDAAETPSLLPAVALRHSSCLCFMLVIANAAIDGGMLVIFLGVE